jgi:hypothetical protein
MPFFKDFYADDGPAQRSHRSVDQQVPADVYQALSKVGPRDPRPRLRNTGPRVLVVSPTGSVNCRKPKIGIRQHCKGPTGDCHRDPT